MTAIVPTYNLRLSGFGQTAATGARGAEHPIPEAGADAEIGIIVIMMRQMSQPRLVKPVAGLDLPVMRGVMHQHVPGVTEQRAAGEPRRRDGIEEPDGEIADEDDEPAGNERGNAYQFVGRMMVRIVQRRKDR